MSIPYSAIPLKQLLGHDGAYHLIDVAGHLLFENWSIIEFEKGILGCNGICYTKDSDLQHRLLEPLSALDKIMPFLKFGENGQHYAYELFLSPPDHWGYRGDPFFWAYASRCFTYDRLPMDAEAFSRKYMQIVAELNIPYGEPEGVHIDRFAAGGMSGGLVSGTFVAEAHDLLLKRLKKYI